MAKVVTHRCKASGSFIPLHKVCKVMPWVEPPSVLLEFDKDLIKTAKDTKSMFKTAVAERRKYKIGEPNLLYAA
jgi:hypothetical protein